MKGVQLLATPQWLKKLKSNSKRQKLGINKVNLHYLDDRLHVVTFINWEFPIEEIMDAVADCTSTWFSEHAVNPLAMQWRQVKSYPILFKVPSSELMFPLLDEKIHKTVSKIGEEPIAICMGPLWNSQVMCYNGYERYQ